MTYGTINRGVSRAQLVMEAPAGFDDGYQMAMLSYNDPDGFLPVSECFEGETRRFYYDVTGSNPLSTLMIHGRFDKKMISRLMEALCNALEASNVYLLDDNKVNLDPGYIYVKGEQYLFCYVPFDEQNFEDSFKELTMFIVDHTDPRDGDAADLAADLYRIALAGSVDVGAIRTIIANHSSRRNEEESLKSADSEFEEERITDGTGFASLDGAGTAADVPFITPQNDFTSEPIPPKSRRKKYSAGSKPRKKKRKPEEIWDLNKTPDAGISEWGDFGEFLDP